MKNKHISMEEEMLIWTSYRYCIGRQTYVSSLAPYIGKKYYDLLSDARAEFMAKDIRDCIEDYLRFGNPNFSYDSSVSREERDALSDFIAYLNDNVNSDKDLINIDAIECYKEKYSDTVKKFHVSNSSRVKIKTYEHNFSDLIIWHTLAALFDRKKHKKVYVKYDGKEEVIECFEAWGKVLEKADDEGLFYKKVPWKYKKSLISVKQYLSLGDRAGYINPEYIIKIEE